MASIDFVNKIKLGNSDLLDVIKQVHDENAPDLTTLIPKTGNTGSITTYETIVGATTVSDTSARSMKLASGGTLTVSNGSADKAWITVVALAGSATINFGSSWSWSGSAPTLGKGLVTLAWYGAFGVATFTKYGS